MYMYCICIVYVLYMYCVCNVCNDFQIMPSVVSPTTDGRLILWVFEQFLINHRRNLAPAGRLANHGLGHLGGQDRYLNRLYGMYIPLTSVTKQPSPGFHLVPVTITHIPHDKRPFYMACVEEVPDATGRTTAFWDRNRCLNMCGIVMRFAWESWDILGYRRISWDIVGYLGISWDILGYLYLLTSTFQPAMGRTCEVPQQLVGSFLGLAAKRPFLCRYDTYCLSPAAMLIMCIWYHMVLFQCASYLICYGTLICFVCKTLQETSQTYPTISFQNRVFRNYETALTKMTDSWFSTAWSSHLKWSLNNVKKISLKCVCRSEST